jgi:hypothetical protein
MNIFPLVPIPAFLDQYIYMNVNVQYAQGAAILACGIGLIVLILAAFRNHNRNMVLFGWRLIGSSLLFLIFGLYVLALAVLICVLAIVYGICWSFWQVFIKNTIIAARKPVRKV